MNADTAPTAAAEPRDVHGLPLVRAATPADAEAITRMRSEHVLSAPFTEDWVRQCTDELAPRLTPEGDAQAIVVDAADGTMAACALGLIHPVLRPRPTPEAGQPAYSWSPRTRTTGVAVTPGPSCPHSWTTSQPLRTSRGSSCTPARRPRPCTESSASAAARH